MESHCDHLYWHLDEYEETDAELSARPKDSGHIDLSEAERDELQRWYNAETATVATPVAETISTPVPNDAEPIFAIGGLNRGDGAETPAPWPRYGQTCRICGESESLGAMFTTLGGDICDDCV